MPISESEIKAEITYLKEQGEVIELDGTEWTFLESDLALDDIELYLYARQRLEARKEGNPEVVRTSEGTELLAKVDPAGRYLRWQRGLVLSYAVQKHTFLSDADYKDVVLAMKRATRDWQELCGVRFEYRAASDTVKVPDDVLFVVRYSHQDSSFTTVARAFFPDADEKDRVVYIFPKWYTTSYDQTGIMRHELGHVLGFRHEHIRDEAPLGCWDEALHNAMALGEYDPQSVMHYLCGGFGSKKLTFTDLDRQGAVKIYGAPDSKCAFFS